jgi:hypothetical protein
MDFKSTPIGGIYRSLYEKYEYADRSPPSKELRDCELRANSRDAESLRVKTGAPSFFGRAKARVAHQKNAADIVSSAVRDQSLWYPRPNTGKLQQAEVQIKEYIKAKNAPLTLGDLSKLEQVIIQTVYSEDRLFETPYPGDASARDSKRDGVPAAAVAPAALSLSLSAADFRRAQPAPASSSSALSAPPSEPQSSPEAAALNALIKLFPPKICPHDKLSALVDIAKQFNVSLIPAEASELSQAAMLIREEPTLDPAAALSRVTHFDVSRRIAERYPIKVDE